MNPYTVFSYADPQGSTPLDAPSSQRLEGAFPSRVDADQAAFDAVHDSGRAYAITIGDRGVVYSITASEIADGGYRPGGPKEES